MTNLVSVLSQFEVSTAQYDGGISLEHKFKDCDWEEWIDGCRLTDLMRQAAAHARACDGNPQPRPERPAQPALNGLMPALWAGEICHALDKSLRLAGN